MKKGIKQLNIRTDAETVKKLKIIAIQKDMTIKEMLNYLIENLVKNAE